MVMVTRRHPLKQLDSPLSEYGVQSIVPDHKAIFLCLQIDQTFKRGPGNWKFSNTLLKDNEYINLIKNSFPSIQEKYHDVENKQLYWELFKMDIRSEFKQFPIQKRRSVSYNAANITFNAC